MKSLIEAVRFLTLLPLPAPFTYENSTLPRSTIFYPLVGFCMGLAILVLLRGFELAVGFVNPLVPAFFVLVWFCVLTRGLHLDGLADSADGLIGGKDPESRLRIMKESTIGSFGAAALILVLLGKFIGLVLVCGTRSSAGLLLPFVLSRMAMVAVLFAFPYVRKEGGLGTAFSAEMRWFDPAVAFLFTAAFLFPLPWKNAVILLGISAGVSLAVALYSKRKIGGVTGDVLGAVNELVETACLFYIGLAAPPYEL
jgi:adenosylcobinamide-GDP ribazoletransferase